MIILLLLSACKSSNKFFGLTLYPTSKQVDAAVIGKINLFVFKPDFGKITGSTVLSALGQVFFSMSLGMGINVAYGSYMKDSMNFFNAFVYTKKHNYANH